MYTHNEIDNDLSSYLRVTEEFYDGILFPCLKEKNKNTLKGL